MDSQDVDYLVKRNILRPILHREMQAYEFYLERSERVGKMQARFETSEKFNMSEPTVYRIIRRMRDV